MKKSLIILGLLAIFFFWMTPTTYASVWVCNLSETDIVTIEEIAVLFDTHAEDKIIKKHFKTEEYRNLARLLTEEWVSQMRTIRNDCESESYTVEWVSMSDMEYWLQEYIYTLLKLKAFEKNHNPNDAMALQSVVLQWHLMDVVWLSGKNILSEYRFDATMNITVTADENIKLTVTTSGEWFGDTLGEKNQWSFTVWVDGSIENDVTGTISVDANMSVDLRMSWWKAFVRVQGFDFDIQSLEMLDDDRQEIQEFIDRIRLIEGKWIALPIGEFGLDAWGVAWGAISYLEMSFWSDITQLLWSTPLLMTYHEEWWVYYGGPNPLFCGVLMTEDIGWCLDEIQEMMSDSQWKWFVTMQALKWSYTMGLSDRYVDEWYYEEEMTDIINQPLIRWNEEKIQRIAITIPEYGEARYDNGNVHVDLLFDITDYDWETDTIITEQWSIKLDGAVGPEHIKIDMAIDSPEFTMSLSLESFKEVIGPRTVNLPDESEVIQLESLLF